MPLHSAVRHQPEYISISAKDCAESLHDSESGREKNSQQLNCKSYHQTTNYTCGPAAVMTLMRFYGRLSPSEMNQKTELRIALEMGSTEQGTSLAQVSSWLSGHGFSVESGRRVDSEMIINNLKKGTPTIISVSHHWILSKGFNKGSTSDKDEIIFSDSCCNTTIITRANIDSMWEESQMPSNHCDNAGEYMVATPK